MTNSATLSTLQTGTAVAIVFDTSGSMEGDKLASAKRAFVEVICPRLAAARGRVEYSLIGCGGSAYVIQPNTLTKPFLDWDRRIKKVCDQAKILEDTKKIDFHRQILAPAELLIGRHTMRAPI